MQEIIFIGTLHCGFTPKKELEKILINYKPDQILVEIAQKDIKKKTLKSYPPEMVFALRWAEKKKIRVNGFDSSINILKSNKSEEDNKKIIKKQEKIIKTTNWKDFNKEKFLNILNKISIDLIDKRKWDIREKEMSTNIKKMVLKKGRILVVTGCGHIPFFKKTFHNAQFPLSN